jgi:hypothetical protein
VNADPFELLRTHVRATADTIDPVTSVDELIAHITLEHHRQPSATTTRPSRRFGTAALATALCVGIGAGAIVTAAVIDRQHVDNVEAGVICRTSATELGSGISVGVVVDPIGACRERWLAGDLPDIDHDNPSSDPPLVACVGSLGIVEVLPGADDTTCTQNGMATADVESMMADSLTALSEGTDEINMRCLPPHEAERAATVLLDELGFEGWRVVVRGSGGVCGLIASGGEEFPRVLFVNPTPRSG